MNGELRVYLNLSLLEIAPVLLAANGIYKGKTRVEHGGVMSLWGKANDLPSLDARGMSHVSGNSETQVLRSSYANPDLRIILTLAECPYRLIARRSAGVSQLIDFEGKRVGVMPNSSAAYFVDRMLRSVGLSQTSVTAVPFMAKTQAPLSLMPHALASGEVDAVAVWEPYAQACKLAAGDDTIEFCDSALYRECFNLCTRAANLQDPALRPLIVDFVRAVLAATRELKRGSDRAQALVARYSERDVNIVKNAWPYLAFPAAIPDDLVDVLLPAEVWVARETDRAPRGREALAALIDRSVLREAQA